MPDGGPFNVPGIDGVFGFGLIGFINGPGTGDAVDVGAMPCMTSPPTTGGAAIMTAGGRCGPLVVDSICNSVAAQQPVSVTKDQTKVCSCVA